MCPHKSQTPKASSTQPKSAHTGGSKTKATAATLIECATPRAGIITVTQIESRISTEWEKISIRLKIAESDSPSEKSAAQQRKTRIFWSESGGKRTRERSTFELHRRLQLLLLRSWLGANCWCPGCCRRTNGRPHHLHITALCVPSSVGSGQRWLRAPRRPVQRRPMLSYNAVPTVSSGARCDSKQRSQFFWFSVGTAAQGTEWCAGATRRGLIAHRAAAAAAVVYTRARAALSQF